MSTPPRGSSARVRPAASPARSGDMSGRGGGRPSVVVLAAGSGRRLGRGPKALLRLGEETLAARAVRTAAEAGGRPVLVVGPRGAEIAASARSAVAERIGEGGSRAVGRGGGEPADRAPRRGDPGELVVVSVDGAKEGMSRSWRAGAGCALDLAPGLPVAVLLVDQPGVGPEVLARLLRAHRPGRITRATYRGRPGHPVVLDPSHAEAAARRARGDAGAGEYLRAHSEVVDAVECGDLGTDEDVDIPADLARWPGMG